MKKRGAALPACNYDTSFVSTPKQRPSRARRHERAAACARAAALQPAPARAARRARQSRRLPRRLRARAGGAALCPCGAAAAASRRGCVRRSRAHAPASAADASSPAARAAAERGGAARPGGGARLARRRYGACFGAGARCRRCASSVAHSFFPFWRSRRRFRRARRHPRGRPVAGAPPAARSAAPAALRRRKATKSSTPRKNPAPPVLAHTVRLASRAAAAAALHRGRAARARAFGRGDQRGSAACVSGGGAAARLLRLRPDGAVAAPGQPAGHHRAGLVPALRPHAGGAGRRRHRTRRRPLRQGTPPLLLHLFARVLCFFGAPV